MNVKIIGIGAAGNKAAINTVNNGIVGVKDILLLNTTVQDIPAPYKDQSVIFNDSANGGCGKERSRSKELMIKALKTNLQDTLNAFINPNDLVTIVSSTEGGTGSGAAPILASFIAEVIGVRPQLIAFTGTEDDLRGLQNTADYFKDMAQMCANCTVQTISNKKFIDSANGNKLKAEQLANAEFNIRIRVMQASMIRESEQNIDSMDHLKLITTNGYMNIISYEQKEPIESIEQFNKICTKMISDSKSLPTSGDKIVRLGIIITCSDNDKDNIDWQFEKIKSTFSDVGEVFLHVQKSLDETRQIIIIESGLEMPLNFVLSTYEKFKTRSEAMAKKSTDFMSRMGSLDTSDSMLNFDNATSLNSTTSPSSFFNKIAGTANKDGENGFKNTEVDDILKSM